MAARIQINQAGLAPGTPGVAREDGLAGGELVTIKSLAHEGSFEVNLLWVGQHPDPDTTSVASLQVAGSDGMSFSPTPGVYGTWRIELVTDRGTAAEDRAELGFAIKQSPTALRIPAANERSDPSASLTRNGPSYLARATFNAPDGIAGSPFEDGTYVSWWRSIADLIYAYNAGGGGGGGGAPNSAGAGRSTYANLNPGANDDIFPSPSIGKCSGILITAEGGAADWSGLVPPTDPDISNLPDNPYHLTGVNYGPGAVSVLHNNAGSTLGQRFRTRTNATVVLASGARFELVWIPAELLVPGQEAHWALFTA